MLFLALIFIQLLIFAVLVLFLRVILTRNITNATKHLHQLNEDYDHKLEEAKKRQAEAEKYYDDAVLKAKIDAEKSKVQILKDARQNEEEIVSQARKQSGDIVEQANKVAEAIRHEAEQRIEVRAIEKACALVEEVLPQEITEAMHHRWVDELFKSGLKQLDRLNLPEGLKSVELVTAYALTADQKKSVEKKIKEYFDGDVRVTEKVDPSLIAGFKMTLGSVVVDGSLKLKVNEAVRHAQYAG